MRKAQIQAQAVQRGVGLGERRESRPAAAGAGVIEGLGQVQRGAERPGCTAYLRYVDDMLLFADSKRRLRELKLAILDRLPRLRLRVHEGAAQVRPVSAGVPWLGFVVYPTHRRVKSRKVVEATRRLGTAFDAWRGRSMRSTRRRSRPSWRR